MNFKRNKLFKISSLLLSSIALITIPTTLVSCSNNNVNTNVYAPNQNNNDANSNKLEKPVFGSLNKKVPEINKNTVVSISTSQFFNGSYVTMDENIQRYFTNKTNIQNMITNKNIFTEKELNNMSGMSVVNFNSQITKMMTWGQKNYEQWNQNQSTTYFYSNTNKKIEIDTGTSFIDSFKKNIQLTDISKKDGTSNQETDFTSFTIDETCKPKIIGNNYNIPINIVKTSGSQITNPVALEVPMSYFKLILHDYKIVINNINNPDVDTSTRRIFDLTVNITQ